MADLGPDRQVAWKVLAVVLKKLRDRLPLGLAAHLGAQLPILIRGIYYDQFEPSKLPTECDSREEFVAEVAEWLSDIRPVDPDAAVRSVFKVLSHHSTPARSPRCVKRCRGRCVRAGRRRLWSSRSKRLRCNNFVLDLQPG